MRVCKTREEDVVTATTHFESSGIRKKVWEIRVDGRFVTFLLFFAFSYLVSSHEKRGKGTRDGAKTHEIG